MVAFIGPLEFALLFVVILLIFGSKRFVSAARSLGRGAREFKRSISAKDEKKRAELPSDGGQGSAS